MGNVKAKIIAAGSLCLILALCLTAGAQQTKQPRAGMADNAAIRLQIRDFIQGLRLSETQREDIGAILQAHRADIRETRKALLQARLALAKEDPSGPGLFGSVQTRVMELRLRILAQIKSKLTADQLDILQKREQRRADRLQSMLDRLGN